jgi:hypothetical protein
MEQSVNGGSGGGHDNDATMREPTTVISLKELNELKMSVIESERERLQEKEMFLQEKEALEQELGDIETIISCKELKELKMSVIESEREKLQQKKMFLQEKAALEQKLWDMEARAKDMELANLRLQLEQEKGRNKRGYEQSDGRGPGPRRRSGAPS